MAATFGPYPARCVAIHDGDTIIFDIDLGFGVHFPGRSWSGKTMLACRVEGINAPELSTDAGKAALVYAQSILRSGDICQVVSYGWDKYGGRFDGSITLPDGTDYAERLVAAGYAVYVTY